MSMRRHQSASLWRGFRLLPPVNAGLLRASARSAMLAVRTDKVLLTRAVASPTSACYGPDSIYINKLVVFQSLGSESVQV